MYDSIYQPLGPLRFQEPLAPELAEASAEAALALGAEALLGGGLADGSFVDGMQSN